MFKLAKNPKEHIIEKSPIILNSNNAIEVNNLTFNYSSNSSKNVINNVSYKIKKGKYVTILGHNGSGKSTMSKLLLGILIAKSGSIKIYGSDLSTDYTNAKKHISVVFQNPDNQFIGTTVKDDIAFGLENICVDPKDMVNIVINAAKVVGMEKLLDVEPIHLSGGQKQKVAIAGAIALNTDIIIFDEATSMLDPMAKIEIKNVMKSLCKDLGKTIISITHDMDEAQHADQIIVLNKGSLVYNAKPLKVFSHVKEIQSMGLDLPTSYKISNLLQVMHKDFPLCENTSEILENVCKLISKK